MTAGERQEFPSGTCGKKETTQPFLEMVWVGDGDGCWWPQEKDIKSFTFKIQEILVTNIHVKKIWSLSV